MNAGCFGASISDRLISCKIINRDGNIKEILKENLILIIDFLPFQETR